MHIRFNKMKPRVSLGSSLDHRAREIDTYADRGLQGSKQIALPAPDLQQTQALWNHEPVVECELLLIKPSGAAVYFDSLGHAVPMPDAPLLVAVRSDVGLGHFSLTSHRSAVRRH